jgi:hypothetical protein
MYSQEHPNSLWLDSLEIKKKIVLDKIQVLKYMVGIILFTN